jgi:sodium/hydrogen exchanger 8
VICCLIFKKCRFLTTNPVTEVCLVIIFGLMGYTFSEIFDLSGVISLLVVGIALSHYNFYNLSMTGQVATGVTLQTISSISEGFIFVYLGLNFWTIFKDENGNDYWWSWSFVGFEILICTFARVISVYILSGIMKVIRRKSWKVSCRELNVVWYSGIVRGSVAFALILTVQPNTPEQLNQIQVMKSGVLFMVFFTTIFIGGLMPLVIKYNLNAG